MFMETCCCCLKAAEKTDNVPINVAVCGGITNLSFETWEAFEQQKSPATVTLERPCRLSKSSSRSCESIKLSKIDLNLNIFENNRFCDVSQVIHKSNSEHIQN